MRMLSRVTAIALGSCLLLAGAAQAETKVTLSNVHLCCPQCVKAVGAALTGVDGVKHEANQAKKTVALTADSDAAAQRAIDALAAAGFHGKLDNNTLKYKEVAAPEGNVKRLELGGVHNCCGQCTKILKAALAEVDGVSADTVQAKQDTFVVEGDFSAAAVVKALLDAGFHVNVKK